MAGSSWPALSAGARAKASDVEAKFDWLEASLAPMLSGATTDVVYDLGTTTARWNHVYFGGRINIGTISSFTTTGQATVSQIQIGNNTSTILGIAGNATSLQERWYFNADSRAMMLLNMSITASGPALDMQLANTAGTLQTVMALNGRLTNVSIGTTTGNAGALLDVMGVRTILFPRMSTAERDLITAVDGMVLYNTTSAQFQARENGSWQAMIGVKIGPVAKVKSSVVAGATATVINILAAGRLVSNLIDLSVGGNWVIYEDSVTADFSIGSGTATTGAVYLQYDLGATTGTYGATTASTKIDSYFKEQLKLFIAGNGANTIAAYVIYERT